MLTELRRLLAENWQASTETGLYVRRILFKLRDDTGQDPAAALERLLSFERCVLESRPVAEREECREALLHEIDLLQFSGETPVLRRTS